MIHNTNALFDVSKILYASCAAIYLRFKVFNYQTTNSNMTREVDVKALISHIVRGDGADKCRICLGDTSEGRVFLNDTVMVLGDKPVTLAELLETITGVEVAVDDVLPNGLCVSCSAAASEAAKFKKLCQEAAGQWESTLSDLETIPDYKYDVNSKSVYAIFIGNEITFVEPEIERPSNSIRALRSKDAKRKAYMKSLRCQCPTCGKKFVYSQDLYKHLKESSDSLRACYLCANIMSRDDLILHLDKIHGKKPFDCKKCPAVLLSLEQYRHHMYSAHVSGACTCGDCGRSFQSTHAYHAHLSVHTPKTCPSCSKPFRNQTCYLHHVKKCCNLDKNRRDLHQTKHKLSVLVKNKDRQVKVGLRGSSNRESICDYCKKTFAGKKVVAAHIQIVHLKNTHSPCPYCGKLLAAAHMTTHVKTHELIESYKCDQCGVTLKTKLGYVQHLRLHTGEKPYICKYCGDSFSAASRRSEHIRKVHNSSNLSLRHACEFCPAKFRLPYRLKKHISVVHSNKNTVFFECGTCKIKFASYRALMVHNRTHQAQRIEV